MRLKVRDWDFTVIALALAPWRLWEDQEGPFLSSQGTKGHSKSVSSHAGSKKVISASPPYFFFLKLQLVQKRSELQEMHFFSRSCTFFLPPLHTSSSTSCSALTCRAITRRRNGRRKRRRRRSGLERIIPLSLSLRLSLQFQRDRLCLSWAKKAGEEGRYG